MMSIIELDVQVYVHYDEATGSRSAVYAGDSDGGNDDFAKSTRKSSLPLFGTTASLVIIKIALGQSFRYQ